MHLQHDSLLFLPLALRFMTFWLGHVLKLKFWEEKVTYVLRLFDFWKKNFGLSFFSFSFLFAAVIDLLLGLLAVEKLLRKRHRDRQFLPLNQPTFWAFLCISLAPFSQSPWSGHHWKDVFLQQRLSIDDANFGQKRWCQRWKKDWSSSRPVTGGTGVNGLNNIMIGNCLFLKWFICQVTCIDLG